MIQPAVSGPFISQPVLLGQMPPDPRTLHTSFAVQYVPNQPAPQVYQMAVPPMMGGGMHLAYMTVPNVPSMIFLAPPAPNVPVPLSLTAHGSVPLPATPAPLPPPTLPTAAPPAPAAPAAPAAHVPVPSARVPRKRGQSRPSVVWSTPVELDNYRRKKPACEDPDPVKGPKRASSSGLETSAHSSRREGFPQNMENKQQRISTTSGCVHPGSLTLTNPNAADARSKAMLMPTPIRAVAATTQGATTSEAEGPWQVVHGKECPRDARPESEIIPREGGRSDAVWESELIDFTSIAPQSHAHQTTVRSITPRAGSEEL